MAQRPPLVVTALPGFPVVRAGDDLAALILAGLRKAAITLRDGDIVALAQKIVSKAEARRIALATVTPGPRALELASVANKDPRVVELILRESNEVLRCRPGVIVVEHRRGYVMANAGIDASNVEGDDETVLLLPENPDASAARLREQLREVTGASVGVVIIDSFGRAWRLGTVGTAIGLAGMPGLLDLRGRPDMNGRALQTSELGAADEVAAAASLVMGQADEGTPVVHISGFPHALREGNAGELLRPKHMDLFR